MLCDLPSFNNGKGGWCLPWLSCTWSIQLAHYDNHQYWGCWSNIKFLQPIKTYQYSTLLSNFVFKRIGRIIQWPPEKALSSTFFAGVQVPCWSWCTWNEGFPYATRERKQNWDAFRSMSSIAAPALYNNRQRIWMHWLWKFSETVSLLCVVLPVIKINIPYLFNKQGSVLEEIVMMNHRILERCTVCNSKQHGEI